MQNRPRLLGVRFLLSNKWYVMIRAACGLGGRKEDECGLSKAPQTARHDGTQEHVTYETRCSRDGIARDATADCLMRNDNVSRN